VILLRPDAGAIEWQLGSAATEVAKEGRVDVYEFSPGRLDELIFALFDQETWQRRQIPRVGGGWREPTPTGLS
jgi:hypothetical protein